MAIELIRNDDDTVTLKDWVARTMPDGRSRRHVRHAVTYEMEMWLTLASTLMTMAAADESELRLRRAGRPPLEDDARRFGSRGPAHEDANSNEVEAGVDDPASEV